MDKLHTRFLLFSSHHAHSQPVVIFTFLFLIILVTTFAAHFEFKLKHPKLCTLQSASA